MKNPWAFKRGKTDMTLQEKRIARRDQAMAKADIRNAQVGETVRRASDGMEGTVHARDEHGISIIFRDHSTAIVRLTP